LRQPVALLARRGDIDGDDQQPVAGETGVDVRERARAADQHARPHQQRE
jgi:hypothetical protein